MSVNEVLDRDAVAQAEAITRGEVSPTELVSAALERIEQRNPELNAVIHLFADEALAIAADPALPKGPFRGVPFLLKDGVAHSAGHPFHCGMQVLKDAGHTEATDTELVRRIRAAGFVIMGKTNLPELATICTTEPVAYGATHNPWDLTLSPGGSSGGSAAAVASGMVAVAHGNDMGGSIRLPAAVCGLVGLKPTRARTSLGPDLGEFWGPLTHEFVLVRSVRDAAVCLDALAGPALGDPYTAPAPKRPWRDDVSADPGSLRIGFRTDVPGTRAASHADCVAAVESTAELLAELGHRVEPVTLAALDDPGIGEGVGVAICAAVARELDRWGECIGRALTEADVEPTNWFLASAGRGLDAVSYITSIERMQKATRSIGEAWAEIDVLVTPTVPEPSFPLGQMNADVDPLGAMGRASDLCGFTIPFNATGQPAVSLPLHWSDEGLPVGVQLVGPYGREDILLRLSAQLEHARPWAPRRVPGT